MLAAQPKVINYTLLPFWDVLLKDTIHEEVAVPGGYRSGKTTGGVCWHHLRCTWNIGCESWWVSPDYSISNEGFKTYVKVIESLGYVENVHFSCKRSIGNQSIYYYAYDHLVSFKSTNSNLQAATLSHLTIDEAGDCDKLQVGNAVVRVSDPKAVCSQKLFLGAPQGLNHYYDRFNLANMTTWGKFGQFCSNGDKLVLHFRSYWNHFIPRAAIKALIEEFGSDPLTAQAWILGLFVPLSQNNCYRFDQSRHVKHCSLDPENKVLYLSFDFNVGQVSYVVAQRFGKDWKVPFEAPKDCRTTPDAVSAFLQQVDPKVYKNHELIVDGDANGWSGDTRGLQSDYDHIIHGLRPHFHRLRIIAPNYNTSVQHRIHSTNRDFNNNHIEIDPSVKFLIEGLLRTTWDKVKGGIKKSSQDTWTHRPDALSYLISRQHEQELQGGVVGVTW